MSSSTTSTSPPVITEQRSTADGDDSQNEDSDTDVSDKHLSELLELEMKKQGVNQPKISPVPNSNVSFVFCLIEGKTRPMQVI